MATNTASAENFGEIHFFYEDEVLKFDKNGRVKFGLVLESYEANYSESESDFEDSVKKGEIRVAWHPVGNVEVIEEQNIGLADRTLMPGNVVRRIGPGKDTQKGYCRNVFVSADVQVKGTTYVLRNVSSERLRPLDTFVEDDVVCLDSWVGSIKRIDEKLILKTTCGARVEIVPTDRHFFKLRDPDSKHRNGYFHHTIFHPGQTLIGSVNALKNELWLTPKPERLGRSTKFTVESVEIDSVRVNWQCMASDNVEWKCDYKTIPPNTYITGNNLNRLKRLNLFETSMLQINDTQYLKIEERDLVNLTSKSQWRKKCSTCYDNYKILHNRKPAENQQKIKIVESLPMNEKALKSDGEKKINFSPKVKLCSLTVHNGRCNNCDNIIESNAKRQIEVANKKKLQIDDFNLNGADDDEDGWTDQDEDDDDSYSDITTASSRGSTPTPRSSPKRSPLLSKKDKKLKKRSSNTSKSNPPNVGDEVVTEAILVYSEATVVWQDGTIESGISSRHLYPIHHLDEHEFFPGDFVLSGSECNDLAYRNYGVIQRVDHNGRTAMVKWFRTYSTSDASHECCPQFLNESEASVYDLKDHPDFQFRPGMIVLRVSNFEGEHSKNTVGQVIDNFAEGRVKVWWVGGHISMCWPQDLFEVGQPEDSFWIGGDSENDDEWETESETSEIGSQTDTQLKPELSYNLERARIAMAHLEEMFKLNPNLESQGVVRKLLEVYKKCRFIDRLMNTTFFHTDNFKGLLERVRHGSTATSTTAARVQDHKNRLFGTDESSLVKSPTKSVKPTFRKQIGLVRIEVDITERDPATWKIQSIDETNVNSSNSTDTRNCAFDTKIPNKDNAAKELNENNHLTVTSHQNLKKSFNSGIEMINSNWGEGSRCSTGGLTDTKLTDDQTSNSCSSIDFSSDELPESVCARLCALMKVQLFKSLEEINKRVNSNPSVSVKIDETFMVNGEADLSKELSSYNETNSSVIEDGTIATETLDIDTNYSVINPVPSECFVVLENALSSHKFETTVFHPSTPQFSRAVRFDHKLLRTSLPAGVWVKTYGDRLDLLSVMIEGPKKTPYEDGLFLFDFQLSKDYPRAPPLCHYISFCSDRLNPNLYEDGKVCVSLLGTWPGKGSEMWSASSTLLQVIVSIQGLILVAEPYYNEAGYEKQRGTQQGIENSRMYNEMVVLKLVESMTKIATNPPEVFRDEIIKYLRERGEVMCNRIKGWMDLSTDHVQTNSQQPEFSLVPASRGFCLKLVGLLDDFRNKLEAMN
ncbi:(E3-independent) E2 ubiquitin-conjugating enzyme [Pseudolycoriella hygida]|uniref:(E3-independent) E2 ubiquitin-conjugating enzyme n=1 Tax=Pseudolycoriella hygida TaxID=35572 RepID=A0A9Q0MJS8_9DIPT|nr:(E3-independent) E2 ubiquitin-conjugating enzyme [Pseudolycoriella hygida]